MASATRFIISGKANRGLEASDLKRLPEREPASLAVPAEWNYNWSFDFMSDALYNGTRFRVLNIIDEGVIV